MRLPLLGVLACVSAAPLAAQTTGISHQPVGCLVAGKYPRLLACVDDPDGVAAARAFFRAEGAPVWHHVPMQREEACFTGVLPRPKRDLAGSHVQYYLEADHRRLGSPRTPEHRALVVRSSGECAGPMVAAISASGPSAVLPALPSGFAAGGLGAGTVAAVVGAGVAAGGAAVGVAGGGEAEPEPPAAPASTAPAVTTPPATTAPPVTTLPQPGPPLAVACDARPDRGNVPLAVKFEATASGGEGPTSFRWDFGDGSSPADGPAVEHEYRVPGQYRAAVRVTRGSATQECARMVSAGVDPPGRITLTAGRTGTGSGHVGSSPAGIDCGATCSAPFDAGSTVRFTATPAPGSTFRGWRGLCSGSGSCVVNVPQSPASDQLVLAEFESLASSLHTLTVTRTGAGTVTSEPGGIACGGACSAQFATGTKVLLTPEAASGSAFGGWTGACAGEPGKCELTMTSSHTTHATFNSVTSVSQPLTVTLAGRGTGTVSGQGISCPGDCAESYPTGTAVSLQAQPGPQTVFSGWEQDCLAQSSLCQLTMSAPRAARARFDLLFRLDVSVTGPGHVTGPSINCPPTCGVTRVDGAVVTLTALPDMSSVQFGGWDGDCAGTATTCTVTMNQNRFVGARFGSPLAGPGAAPSETAWRSHLGVPRGSGSVRAGGQRLVVGAGLARVTLSVGAGDAQVEAEIGMPAPAGSRWRFEAEGGVEPGSLAGLVGEVVELGDRAIAFRLQGREGERVAFSFRAARPSSP